MATIGNISVSLTAKTAQFQTGLNRAKKMTRKFGQSLRSLGKRILKVGVAMAAVAAAAIVYYTKKAMTAIDATAKLADRLGITTEALIGLQHAAKISGADSAAVAGGLEKMSKALGEAAQTGIGEASDALEILGLSAKALVKMAPEKALGVLSKAINKVETASERAYLWSRIMGRGASKLLNMLNLNEDQMAKLTGEAKKLGLTFSRLEAGRVEAANDAVERMVSSVRGLWQMVAIKAAPAVKDLADRFTEIFSELGKSGQLDGLIQSAVTVARVLGEVVLKLTKITDLLIPLSGIDIVGKGYDFSAVNKMEKQLAAKRASKLAAAAKASAAKRNLTDNAKVANLTSNTKKSKAGTFRQTEFDRIALGGVGSGRKNEQVVKAPKLEQLMQSVERNTAQMARNSGAVVAAG